MRDKTREEILREVGEQIKAMVKELLERLMQEERALYLAEHPIKANGYYTHNLLTLTGPLEDLKVPRVREGGFHPRILPYRRRTSPELSEAILTIYAAGMSTRAISRFLVGIYGAFYSPQSISRLTQVVEEEVKAWWERPLGEDYYAVFLDGTFSFCPAENNGQGAGVHCAGSEAGWTPRDLGLLCFWRKGEVPGTGRKYSKISGVGV